MARENIPDRQQKPGEKGKSYEFQRQPAEGFALREMQPVSDLQPDAILIDEREYLTIPDGAAGSSEDERDGETSSQDSEGLEHSHSGSTRIIGAVQAF
ncbi:MAG: hypothetical protein LAN62_08585 [Acidobacteriia bacterium]|nr:hypothetical protein [Terriglobia bacterium]